MADSMQGAGGTPVNETKQKLAAMRESGAASEAIKDYASGNNIPELSYEYNPYVPDPIVVVPIAGQPVPGGSGGSVSSNNPDMEAPDNAPTVSGNALPGLTGGYVSITDMFDGAGPGGSLADAEANADAYARMNYGGEVEGYRNGGQIPEEEYASYMTMAPIAKTKIKEAPLAPALREQEARYDKESPWYSDMAMQLGSAVAGKVLSKGVATAVGAAFPPAAPLMLALGMSPFNKGGKVCPCGTPGCPGCGKGYNDGSYVGNNMPGYSNDKSALYKPDIKRAKLENLRPLMASSNIWPASSSDYGGGYPIELQHPVGKGGYKEKIALKESEAKIRREDGKALFDMAMKIKGPLQGE